MSETIHAPGRFCWVELATSDDKAARGFYSELFGWKTESNPMGEGEGEYTMLRLGDKDVGGLYTLLPDQTKLGIPPHWLSYVTVEDADAAAAKARSLGGTVDLEPLDIFDIGRMAVVGDPSGARLAVWQAKKRTGTQVWGEPGSACWNELISHDTGKAGPFYASLFGWELDEQEMGPITYTMLKQGEMPAGGMLAAPPEMAQAPSHWMVYFAVGDCEETVSRATGMGATVCAPPMDVPGVGRMAVLADPQGAAFAVIKLQS